MKEVIDRSTPEVKEVFMAAVRKMRESGAVVDEISVPEHRTGDQQSYVPLMNCLTVIN